MKEIILSSLMEAKKALDDMIQTQSTIAAIESASQLICKCFENQGHVYSAGNGGSMCDAMHFAEELSGRYRKNRKALGAQAIADPSHISCTANDYGYDYVFSRYLEAHGRKGDIFLGISTSGKSTNIIKAASFAKSIGMKTIILTGHPNSPLSQHADLEICTPGGNYADRVQELHIKVIHILMELVERKLFPENYKD